MPVFLRALLVAVSLFALGGCQLIYKLPTRQGNVIDQKDLDKLQTGMTREQVKFLMGTPIASNPFRDDRWDYVGYYKSPRGKVTNRTVSIYFDSANLVARMDGIAAEGGDKALSSPDMKTVIKAEQKDKSDAERAEQNTESGVIITPEQQP